MPVIDVRGLDLDTLEGRPLVRGLTMSLDRDRVALVGRNGVGKSTLLRVLAGEQQPKRGTVQRGGSVLLVPQDLPEPADASPGERRRMALQEAFAGKPDLLLLDEPTEDLDAEARQVLFASVEGFRGALVVVSHDTELLAHIAHFFVMEESGCHLVNGTLDDLLAARRESESKEQAKYVRALNHLEEIEDKHEQGLRRRKRKKAVGRIHELDRSNSKMRLNLRRSAAQVSQGKAKRGAESRIAAQRAWARAARRALQVDLPLSAVVPAPFDGVGPAIDADVSVGVDGRVLVDGFERELSRERIAVVGPNGAGKTTLLEVLVGERPPLRGQVKRDPARIGYVAQGGGNWMRDESLVEWLARFVDAEAVASKLVAHRFPLALADRPLATLSPGERTRAALIALFERAELEILVLDEPTRSLDLLGAAALVDVLREWRGGLVVASHDRAFLHAIGCDETLGVGR